jgi:peptidoglycan/xylan/chitin deacetylase (PgdA/CDA1 family)
VKHGLLSVAAAVSVLVLCGVADAHSPTPVPILEYHVIGDPPPGTPVPGLYTSVADFRGQLAWLAAHGYTAVTLDRVYRHWFHGGSLPRKPVALTFDDGYPEDWQVVMPLLRARGWPGNLNLQIGNLVPVRVRQLIAAGWEIDAHTFSHPDLTRVSSAQLRREIAGSRRWIQNVFKQPVSFFCFPYGRYDDAVVAEVRRAGFLGAETEVGGFASPHQGMWTLDRFEIVRDDGVAGLARRLG